MWEWIPSLSGRHSVVTVQGYKRAPDEAFGERVTRYLAVQPCAYRCAECLED